MKLTPIEILILSMVVAADKDAGAKAQAILDLHALAKAHPDESENLTHVAHSIIGPAPVQTALANVESHEAALSALATKFPAHAETLKASAKNVKRHTAQLNNRGE